jgi:hypothetical protein
MSTGLTLFDIETDLLNLMLCREAVLNDPDRSAVLEEGETRESELELIDRAIQERVSAEIAKVDGIAYYLREFEARENAADAELRRMCTRKVAWKTRRERLQEMVIAVMNATGKTRLEGRANTLKLVKNPPSVEIAQPELVPTEYKKLKVTMPYTLWNALWEACPKELREEMLAVRLGREDSEPMKSKITEALKQRVQCGGCAGSGRRYHGVDWNDCPDCAGTGKVNQGVPGCSLVRDKMRLVVE